ncbi:MAG: hypothetical protein HKN30_04810 [Sulfitobacter sp.]|nr:hypothetical protein [Sulfitobacter sp.]
MLWPGPEARQVIPATLRLPPLSQMRSARLIPEGPWQKRLVKRLRRNAQPCLKGFEVPQPCTRV